MTKLKVQLFGHFMLEGEDGTTLGEEELRSGKLIRVLGYLLTHRDEVIMQWTLVELFLQDTVKNPENTIRNLIYRLRSALKALGDDEFICSLPGAYQWNPEIAVETDYDRLTELADQLKKYQNKEGTEEDASGRRTFGKELCREIIHCFNGNVTSKLSGEIWMLPKAVWFRTVYFDAVKQLCRILEKENEWNEIELLSRYALECDVYEEECHCWLIRSLYRQNRLDEAVSHYESVKKQVYEGLGIQKLEKLEQVYKEIFREQDNTKMDIATLMQSIEKKEGWRPSDHLCSYHVFAELYRIEVKRIERLGIVEYMVMLTLRRTSGSQSFRGGEGRFDNSEIDGSAGTGCCRKGARRRCRHKIQWRTDPDAASGMFNGRCA